ncbi:DUF4424 domain-containing protein [Mesorhizobium retamae]|uniref:DUF4424 domain-containing protein n=1 Tax=Mesorhizobium retamae TaxID=2912854 RepID=A0ABS9QKY3_9HYPH|nr:DUF4424 domain-containing protein [Mesorhizobium sp. IRAMC:0171]MCG7508104.1 DUF4424 domain-containing protein [Mesorhizobium sp. IRAMC:0171]
MVRIALTFGLALAAVPALANDSTAELGAGGLILSRNDAVSMDSEDLFISPDKVTVDYVFRNTSDKDVNTIVAFPLPEIEASPYEMPSIPEEGSENFLGFEVTVDGVAVKPELEQKAFAVGVDVSEELKAQSVPLYPYGKTALAALAKLPQQVADDWLARGIIVLDQYDDGSGWKSVRSPYWQLRSTFWWRAAFPAGKPVHVSHRYKPSVGATAGLTFFNDGKFQGEYDNYKRRYCLDDALEAAVRKAQKANTGSTQLYESRIAYILTTGGNWATGSIGRFKLTVDKLDARSLVSFCGTGVKKTGPTTFEMTAEDFVPERDIDILLLNRPENESGN